MNNLLSDDFKTELGTIKTWIESDIKHSIYFDNSIKITTVNYQISLQRFELPNKFSCNSSSPPEIVKSFIGWRWFIEKISENDERLFIYCKLIDPQVNTTFSSDTGECLDATEIENEIYHLHIGTEDAEVLQSRAKLGDLMPQRFNNLLGWHWNKIKQQFDFCYSFTEYIDFGFKINIPKLFKGEKIYFHFLVATNPIQDSQENSGYMDISTWLAVDRSKRFLDEYLNETKKD